MSSETALTNIVQIDAPVISNTAIVAQHNVLVCHAPAVAQAARPGNFVNVLADDTGAKRKPFSVFQADPESGSIALLYQIHGTTTNGMAGKQPGDTLDLIGPLGGHVFDADPDAAATHVMVGGGYGVPPLVFLAQRLRAARPDCALRFVLGARSKDLLLCEAEIAGLDIVPDLTTEDGSHGVQGRVTDTLQKIIAAHGPASSAPARVYTCGPSQMMRAVAEMCLAAGVPCQVSLGVPMPCGVGTCGECLIETADTGKVLACLHGPVLDARHVVWK